jgi:hypothetical protein
MKLKIKESRMCLSKKLLAIGIHCTDSFLKRSPDQNSNREIIVVGLLGVQCKIPDTTRFNN